MPLSAHPLEGAVAAISFRFKYLPPLYGLMEKMVLNMRRHLAVQTHCKTNILSHYLPFLIKNRLMKSVYNIELLGG